MSYRLVFHFSVAPVGFVDLLLTFGYNLLYQHISHRCEKIPETRSFIKEKRLFGSRFYGLQVEEPDTSIEEALLTQQHCESDRCVFLPFAIMGPP